MVCSAWVSTALAAVVRGLAEDWGMAVLVVEHDMNFVMDVCDEVVVLDFGKMIASGSPEEIQSNPAVVAAYLGDETDEDFDEDDEEGDDGLVGSVAVGESGSAGGGA